MRNERMFPILGRSRVGGATYAPIPWRVIAPHALQAMKNHDQTLERLAERGGLSPCEAIAVLEDRYWSSIPDNTVAEQLLRKLVKELSAVTP